MSHHHAGNVGCPWLCATSAMRVERRSNQHHSATLWRRAVTSQRDPRLAYGNSYKLRGNIRCAMCYVLCGVILLVYTTAWPVLPLVSQSYVSAPRTTFHRFYVMYEESFANHQSSEIFPFVVHNISEFWISSANRLCAISVSRET